MRRPDGRRCKHRIVVNSSGFAEEDRVKDEIHQRPDKMNVKRGETFIARLITIGKVLVP